MNKTALVRTVAIVLVAVVGGGCATETEPPAPQREAPAPAAAVASGAAPTGSWPGWGGPTGDFKTTSSGLADAWPAEGPPVVWERTLGDGYSAIAVDGDDLYTMYRDGDDDVAVAMRSTDGTTVWEHRYEALTREGNTIQFGKGPNATPLILSDRVVTLGYTGVLNCLDRKTGDVLWSHELIDELGGDVLDFGYSASPILHDGNVVVLVGGEQAAVMAFAPTDGSVAWKSEPGGVSYATPIVIDVDGLRQIVYFSGEELHGIDAANGSPLWSFPVVNQYKNNATDPIWGDDGLLWAATQLDGGTRALRLSRDGDATKVEEVWSSNKLSIHFWNTLRLDDTVFASIGSNATILAAVDIATGEIRWRERGFEQVNFVHAGDRTLMLDAKGHLAMARLTPEGLDVMTNVRITEEKTWTPPSLVGTRLYMRDQKSIRAFELGSGAVGG